MLRAIAVASHYMRIMPTHAMNMIRSRGGKFHSVIRGMKDDIKQSFDEYLDRLNSKSSLTDLRAKLQNELADAQQEDHQTTFLSVSQYYLLAKNIALLCIK
jgi:hypothetical protein